MGNLNETAIWVDGVPYFAADAVLTGGPDCPDNIPIQALTNRTAFLKKQIDDAVSGALVTMTAKKLQTARTITMTGDGAWVVSFDGSGNATAAMALTATGVAAGTYPVVTVDSKGRVTSGRTLTAADIPALDVSKINGAASQTYVQQAIANLLNGAPGALDTLQELAAALGNDANFAATMTNALAGKVSLAQVQTQDGKAFLAGGASPAYTLTPSPAIQAYASPQRFNVTFPTAGATGSNTINVSGLGAIPLKQYAADGTLVSGVVTAGMTSDVQIVGAGSYALLLDPLPAAQSTTPGVFSINTGTVSGNALTVGYPAQTIAFRNAALTSGMPSVIAAAAGSLTIPSGATMGTVSGQQAILALLAINNAGTIEPAVVNLAGGVDLSEAGLISTTAISAGATSAGVVYSQTARTSVPYRVVGAYYVTEATAGTWLTAPSQAIGAGGEAFSMLMTLGMGQTWQNVLASRAASTTYYNTTGRPILCSVTVSTSSASATPTISGTVNAITVGSSTSSSALGATANVTFIVPPGGSYSISIGGSSWSLIYWAELR